VDTVRHHDESRLANASKSQDGIEHTAHILSPTKTLIIELNQPVRIRNLIVETQSTTCN
jgi:hypothetical protein